MSQLYQTEVMLLELWLPSHVIVDTLYLEWNQLYVDLLDIGVGSFQHATNVRKKNKLFHIDQHLLYFKCQIVNLNLLSKNRYIH